jgi:hypothetical protein
MHANKSISWVVGLSILAGGLIATPAKAESSYSDITEPTSGTTQPLYLIPIASSIQG